MKIRLPGRIAALAAALVAALGLFAAPAVATTRDADPALWVVRDADTTVYLFGTVHFLPKDLAWFDDAVADAFKASDELRMELLPVDNPASLAPLIMRLAVDPNGRTMSQRLSPEDHAAYVKALTEIGLPASQLEPLEPWFIGVQAVSRMYVKAGYEPKSGAEEVLTQAARKAGIPVIYFQNGWDADYREAGGPGSPNWHKSNALKTMRKRPELAGKLKRFIYSAGDTRDAAEAYRLFRGRLPTPDALLQKRFHPSAAPTPGCRWPATRPARRARAARAEPRSGCPHLASPRVAPHRWQRPGPAAAR
jgi:hypothetical protein